MELMACPDCKGSMFILDPDGRIICADDDCYTVFGTWMADLPTLHRGK